MIKIKSKDCKINGARNNLITGDYYDENRPGAIGFTSGFSQDSISITVGKRITVEQLLIELSIVMRISRYDHVYRHHVRDK